MNKFRIWDKKAKSWIKALDFINYLWARNHKSIDLNTVLLDSVDGEDFALCWATGLKDKSDKEIYEGDILRYEGMSLEYPFVGEVIWKNCAFIAYEKSTECRINLGVGLKLEALGNVFENPELLK